MAAQQAHDAQIIVVADPDLLLQRAQALGLPLILERFEPESPGKSQAAGRLQVIEVRLASAAKAGVLNRDNASYVLACLDQAVTACLTGNSQAMVTGPVHKGIINEAGFPFTGHTEYLAEKTGCPLPVMMLQTSLMRVALVTTHLPLSQVSGHITTEHLQAVLQVLDKDLTRLLQRRPTIYVSGLNPHAGEGGHLGREEIDVITPVLQKMQREGMLVMGPLSADTLFSRENLSIADVFLCMYHDQGLPVLKFQGFGEAVNITLGLPFPRTSVDHGTALNLAGSGKASASSLEYAIRCATQFGTRVYSTYILNG